MVDPQLRKLIGDCPHVDARAVNLRGLVEIELAGAVDVRILRGDPAVAVGAHNQRDAAGVIVRRDGDRLCVEGESLAIVSGSGRTVIARGRGAIAIGGGNANVVIASGAGSIAAGGDVYVGGARVSAARDGDAGIPGPVVVAISIPEIPEVTIAGAGNVELHDLAQASVLLQVTGSGDIEAAGKVERVEVEIAGSGGVDAAKLVAAEVKARVSGSGDARVHATQAVTARVQGSGHVRITGNPAHRDTRVVGSGRVSFR